MDEFASEPVWCVVAWDSGARWTIPGVLGYVRNRLLPPLELTNPSIDFRVARWEGKDGRWVEAPAQPKPPTVPLREVLAGWVFTYRRPLTSDGARRMVDDLLTAINDAGFEVVPVEGD